MAMVLNSAANAPTPTPYGTFQSPMVFTGTCRQADFTTTGAIARLALPVGTVFFFAGTRNLAGTTAGIGIIRVLSSNDTIADYYSLDGVALSTLVTD